MRKLARTDVVVIGLGAAGGVAANVLAQAGLKVVGLEAGPYLTSTDFVEKLDEIGGCFTRNLLGDAKFNKEVPSWRPDPHTPAGDSPVVWPMMNAVGGTTVHYGAQSWRFAPGDFRERHDTISRYGEQALPHGTSVADWPISYDDLERYYDLVEYHVGVSGKGGANPFEGPRSRDYPMPPLRETGFCSMIRRGMAVNGFHPFAQPAAINSVAYRNRAGCTYCGVCSGFGCWNDAKSSVLVSTIRDAEATGNLEIRPMSAVTRILVGNDGRAIGVQYRTDGGEIFEQPAGFVVLASYVYENVRRLLLSTSERFPNGLANNAGQVGRHYLAHTYQMMGGHFPGKKLNLFNGSNGQGVVIDDLNGDNFDHAGLGFIRGAVVMAFNHVLPIQATGLAPPDIPKWGAGYKRWLREDLGSTGILISQIETMPYANNFLDLDETRKDPFGDPVVRITYSLFDNEQKIGAHLAQHMERILKASGASKTWLLMPPIPVPVNSHAYGGTRMGDDPKASVVDPMSIAHEVPNLAILGGSTFVSTSSYNPTQTIQALAWRTADHVASNFRALAGEAA